MKTKLKLIRDAYDRLAFLNNITWAPYRDRCLELAIGEEKGHRGSGCDFRKYHPNAISIRDAARMFVVKRIAEYLRGDAMPFGKAYLHTQTSCFYCAALVDEFGAEIRKAWAQVPQAELMALDYVHLVSPEKAEPVTA